MYIYLGDHMPFAFMSSLYLDSVCPLWFNQHGRTETQVLGEINIKSIYQERQMKLRTTDGTEFLQKSMLFH